MDVASSHSSGTGPIVHYELLTADALEAKLVVERDSTSALRDEVDMLRKQTAQSQVVLKTTLNIWWISKQRKLRLTRLLRSCRKKEIKFLLGKS